MVVCTSPFIELDDVLVEKAWKRAKKEGQDFSAVVNGFLKEYSRPKKTVKRDENGFTEKEVQEILQASEDAKRGINVSPAFSSVQEMIEYLHKETA